ncbi:hypothetical protein DFH09DRAFT_1104314 [Mycena vulgaris]|nr:hypothetical protein DFH09DRAFT_1104314 [Mycena vulgaris]
MAGAREFERACERAHSPTSGSAGSTRPKFGTPLMSTPPSRTLLRAPCLRVDRTSLTHPRPLHPRALVACHEERNNNHRGRWRLGAERIPNSKGKIGQCLRNFTGVQKSMRPTKPKHYRFERPNGRATPMLRQHFLTDSGPEQLYRIKWVLRPSESEGVNSIELQSFTYKSPLMWGCYHLHLAFTTSNGCEGCVDLVQTPLVYGAQYKRWAPEDPGKSTSFQTPLNVGPITFWT